MVPRWSSNRDHDADREQSNHGLWGLRSLVLPLQLQGPSFGEGSHLQHSHAKYISSLPREIKPSGKQPVYSFLSHHQVIGLGRENSAALGSVQCDQRVVQSQTEMIMPFIIFICSISLTNSSSPSRFTFWRGLRSP